MKNEYKSIKALVGEGVKIPCELNIKGHGGTFPTLTYSDLTLYVIKNKHSENSQAFFHIGDSKKWKLAEPTKEETPSIKDSQHKGVQKIVADLEEEERSCETCFYDGRNQDVYCVRPNDTHCLPKYNDFSYWKAKEIKPDPVEKTCNDCPDFKKDSRPAPFRDGNCQKIDRRMWAGDKCLARDTPVEVGKKQWKWSDLKQGALFYYKGKVYAFQNTNCNQYIFEMNHGPGSVGFWHGDCELHPEVLNNPDQWLEPLENSDNEGGIDDVEFVSAFDGTEEIETFTDCDEGLKVALGLSDNQELLESIAEKPIEEWAGLIKVGAEVEFFAGMEKWTKVKWRELVDAEKNIFVGVDTFSGLVSSSRCRIPLFISKLEWIAENVDLEGYQKEITKINMALYREEAGKRAHSFKGWGIDIKANKKGTGFDIKIETQASSFFLHDVIDAFYKNHEFPLGG